MYTSLCHALVSSSVFVSVAADLLIRELLCIKLTGSVQNGTIFLFSLLATSRGLIPSGTPPDFYLEPLCGMDESDRLHDEGEEHCIGFYTLTAVCWSLDLSEGFLPPVMYETF